MSLAAVGYKLLAGARLGGRLRRSLKGRGGQKCRRRREHLWRRRRRRSKEEPLLVASIGGARRNVGASRRPGGSLDSFVCLPPFIERPAELD